MKKAISRPKRYSLMLYWLFLFFIVIAGSINARELTIQGEQFFLDGQKFKMYGVRAASGTSINTLITIDGRTPFTHLLEQLDTYKAHGVNTLSVFYEGSSGDFYNPFSLDGNSFTPLGMGHNTRMKQIIEECDKRGMVVIVGVFYQNAPFLFRNAEAVRNVIRLVTTELKQYGNIIINVCNEQNSGVWSVAAGVWDFRSPSKIIELCQIVHQVDSNRLVGSGGYNHTKNDILVKSADLDALLFDTSEKDVGINDSGVLYDRFSAVLANAGLPKKPLANIELYGKWSAQFIPPGVYPDSAKNIYFKDIDAETIRPGLSVFFHSNTWLQGPSGGFKMRFDLGGLGTGNNPGIKWFFEYVQSKVNPNVWSSKDIGIVGASGSSSQYKGTYTIFGSGADIWNRADACRYVYQMVTGDVEVMLRVVSQSNTSSFAKAGIMMREGLDPDDVNAMVEITPGNGAIFQSRVIAGDISTSVKYPGITVPYWLKLVRSGNSFTGYCSTNGVNWVQIFSKTFPMNTSFYVGIAVTSHQAGVLSKSVMDDVTVIKKQIVSNLFVLHSKSGGPVRSDISPYWHSFAMLQNQLW